MAKTKVSQFDAVASNNTDINSVNVAEGCPPSGINNAIREMASLLKKQEVGTDAMTSPDINGGTIDGATIGGSSGVTIGVSDGTVSAPSIKFTSDTNTGIYRGGTDILKFVTAGTDAITIDASQNVTFAGTATMDAFQVESSIVNLYLMESDTTDLNTLLRSNSGNFTVQTISDDKGTVTPRFKIENSTGDISFYEDTGNTAKLFWDASVQALSVNESTIISGGTAATTPSIQASEGGTAGAGFGVVSANDEIAGQLRIAASSQNAVYLEADPSDQRADSWLGFRVDGDNVGRFDSSGNFMVSTTENTLYNDNSGSGLCYRPNLSLDIARESTSASSYMLSLNNTGVDAKFINFAKDGSSVGSIGTIAGNLGIVSGDVGLRFRDTEADIIPIEGDFTSRDNAIDLGDPSFRFNDAYITNGVTTGSDFNDKQNIETLSDAEVRVATACKGLLRKWKWKSAVAEKGDNARTHFGIIAQDLQDAFTAEGLDAGDYAMFMSNTWWEKEISVDAVEADEENGIEAKDAYTYIDTKEEATEGYTEKTRLGVRYNELLAFIISAI